MKVNTLSGLHTAYVRLNKIKKSKVQVIKRSECRGQIDQKDLKRRFKYCDKTGTLQYKVGATRNKVPGDIAGFVRSKGRLKKMDEMGIVIPDHLLQEYMYVQGYMYRVSIVIWFYHKNFYIEKKLKHIDGDIKNNRIENLEQIPE